MNQPGLLRLDDPSAIIAKEEFDEVWYWLAEKYMNKTPKKVFCSENDGCSLNYLYNLCESFAENPMLFFIKTNENSVKFISL